MSLRTLPLLVLNMGGEMLYILDQRLRAQHETDDKTQRGGWSEDDRKRVLNDIVRSMFSKAFMEELMKPQDLYSQRALRCVLTRLAHTSIMRLNPASMDRLYDLMMMAFKYQLLLCPRPRDLLLITCNHVDAVRDMVKDSPCLINQINDAQRQILEMYTPLSDGELQFIRQTLLSLFQDVHVRVSIFLKEKIQNPDGRFVLPTSGPVPHGSDVPGLIRWFNSRGREVRRREFPSGGCYCSSLREGSFDVAGDRVTRLGTNMYCTTSSEDTRTSDSSKNTCKTKQQASVDPNPLAKEELNLLAKLMGGMEVWNLASADGGVKVNLFLSEQEEDDGGISSGGDEPAFGVINIQATQDHQVNTELTRIAEELLVQQDQPELPSNKGDDLLAMMDEL
ncbi:protein OSCP1-like [Astyanax mexicanus]|uniref:protein OSCP1-like n=1 Tax=Astyanax mexicanus TaxID=7994 RepID=UPI0020CB3A7E|nr:protein OSCP1-like [Astyanax mexicanus]